MTTTPNLWPILSLVGNAVLALLLYSLRSTIRIAVLELKEFISEKYATKDYVDQQMKLAERMEGVRTDVRRVLRILPGGDTPQEPSR